MKITKIIILTMAIIASGTSYAQSIIKANGDTLVHISSSGVITNDSNQVIGEITSSGEIKNAQGQQIGSIVGNSIKNASGVDIGSVNENSELLNNSNTVVAKIRDGDIIRNINDEILIVLSEPTSINNCLLAYFYFFYNQ